MKRFCMVFPALLVVAALLSACAGSSGDDAQEQQERLRRQREERQALKVAVLPTLDGLPMFVAKSLGLFDSLKVDVRLKMYSAQMDVDTALLRGRVELGVTDGVRLERMVKDGASLAKTVAVPSAWVLVSNKEARLRSASQLGDKMVAMTRYSATDVLTDRVLAGAKTKAQVFRVQINDVGLRLRMILGGTMDAAWLPEPQASLAVARGHVAMARSGDVDGSVQGWLVCRQDEMAEAQRQRQMTLFAKAYNQAVDSLNRYGVGRYADVVSRWCDVDGNVVKCKINYEKCVLNAVWPDRGQTEPETGDRGF